MQVTQGSQGEGEGEKCGGLGAKESVEGQKVVGDTMSDVRFVLFYFLITRGCPPEGGHVGIEDSRFPLFFFCVRFFRKIIRRHASLCACVHVSAALSVGSTCLLEVAVPCSHVALPCSGLSNSPADYHTIGWCGGDVGSERVLYSPPSRVGLRSLRSGGRGSLARGRLQRRQAERGLGKASSTVVVIALFTGSRFVGKGGKRKEGKYVSDGRDPIC